MPWQTDTLTGTPRTTRLPRPTDATTSRRTHPPGYRPRRSFPDAGNADHPHQRGIPPATKDPSLC
ncbi:hypothetical protein MTES_0162 [Microbacterium testaceum StLB037]|uniref:Uncharacterized protein n=1 Tax=Microbacterium testaceum (strain StLB037) TaxID=979556 RepID=E8N8R7_MICTS|nr:hypothetical protein MTES_0162 [Microbacterium testaceum StLB037]